MTSYPDELKKHLAAGLSVSEAQRQIHSQYPGLRRKHEQAQAAGKVLAALQAAESPAPAAALKTYETVTGETVRIAHGLSKQQWSERRAAKDQVAAPVSNASSEKDYFTQIREIQQRRGCNFQTAAVEIRKTNPQAWVKMMERANPGRSFQHRISRK